jgi:hypothetical protein
LPARTAHAAVVAYRDALRRALSCVTDAVLQVESYRSTDRVLAATLNRGDPVQLIGPPDLFLTLRLHYRVAQRDPAPGVWTAHTAAYYFALQDERERELLAYHWHPESRSRVTWPHLHVGQALALSSRIHLPTGRIFLEDILRLAIEEFGVRPRRMNWETVLRQTRHPFDEEN